MTSREAVNWIINISADIGKSERRDLWHYEQALSEIKELLESLPDVPDINDGDMISRAEAINALKGLPTWWAGAWEFHGYAQPPMTALLEPEDAISAIENLPSVQPEQRWIPCSERLPEPNEVVLISVKGIVDADWIAVDNTGYGCWYRTMKHAIDIDAWMPLPYPWKGDTLE